MFIKINKKVIGIPAVTMAVSAGTTPTGVGQVLAFVTAAEGPDVSNIVGSLRLSPDEARDLANRLIINAAQADAFAKGAA
jgi:hypothetical protein